MRPRLGWLLLPLLLLTASCAPRRTVDAVSRPWQIADLRALDPAEALPPESDLTALYLRRLGQEVQIRLDLLDFAPDRQSDLLLTLWDNDRFAADPLQILIPADRPAQVVERATCTAWIIPRVQRDPNLDVVVLTLRADTLGSHLRVEALTLDPQRSQPYDALQARLDAPPPANRAYLYLAFDHVLPADTPARALRAWDGAHSGPRGERHGLRHLLEAAQRTQTPLILLDARDPRSLAAFDALGQLETLRAGQISGALLLPRLSLPAGLPADWQDAAFELPAARAAYAHCEDSPARWQFAPLSDPTHVYRAAGQTTFPAPILQPDYEPAADGPSLALRRALQALALNQDQTDLLALGGDLRRSNWGTAGYAAAALDWLQARPYLHFLTWEALQTFPARSAAPPRLPLDVETCPPPPPAVPDENLPAARLLLGSQAVPAGAENLARQLPLLRQAAAWAAAPQPQPTACDPLCLLSNERLLAVVDPQGGRLLYLFARSEQGRLLQAVAPSTQLTPLLGDPRDWDPARGWQADPSALLGLDDGRAYQVVRHTTDELHLQSTDGRQRTFRLQG